MVKIQHDMMYDKLVELLSEHLCIDCRQNTNLKAMKHQDAINEMSCDILDNVVLHYMTFSQNNINSIIIIFTMVIPYLRRASQFLVLEHINLKVI